MGMKYLLFIEDKEYPADHDLLVSDYIASFDSVEEAVDYYNKRYKDSKGAFPPPFIVASYDGVHLIVLQV
jgi:hypothetical protein